MDGHPTPSPSHSASASATSPFLKRKLAADDHAPPFPSSFSDARNGLTFNENLGSVSASVADSDTDTDDEMEYDHSSMRNFTAFRLQNNAGENSVRIESSDGGIYGGNGSAAGNSANSAPIGGVNVKDGSVNSSVLGAYCAREESLKREEESGRLKFVCCSNDGTDEHMILLIGLKNVISKQLTNMPKEYIVRLVMDRNHKSVILLSRDVVVGGITYRPYPSQKFAEIAFCAIAGDEQVKGYGTRLMNHLKMHARNVDGLTHFLTYADNNAVGYFVKQGFTKKIHLPRELWFGYIKDYDGGILMECKIDPKFPYTDLSTMVRLQRLAIDEKIRELSNRHTVYQAIDFQKDEAGIPTRSIKVEDIPGLREAGWNPGQYGHSQYKMITSSADPASNQKTMTAFMRHLVKIMHDHPDGWPFKEPVDARDVPDYYEVIMDPMDLQTLSKRVESEVYYVTLDMFIADVKRMFQNARTYNTPDTIYYKCSTRLESHIMNIFQSGLQSGVNKTW